MPEERVFFTSAGAVPVQLGGVVHSPPGETAPCPGVVEDEPLVDYLDGETFDVAGITSVTPLIHEAWEAASEARTRGAITILGGPHLTLMPGESLEQSDVDLVVRGEAEHTIVDVVRLLEKD